MNSIGSGSGKPGWQGGGDWRSRIAAIASDRMSGASSIALDLAGALSALAQEEHSRGLQALRQNLFEAAHDVLSGQGTMAPLVRILNDTALALDGAQTDREGLLAIQRECARYTNLITHAPAEIARRALLLLKPGSTVLTLSHSSVVETALLTAQQVGSSTLRAICLESRPGLEGRALASRLAHGGVQVALAVDAAADDLLRDADMWLAGADSLTVGGAINKIGTAVVAACAARLRVPGYVLCDTSKFWPVNLPPPRIVENDPTEVWDATPEGVVVHNRYFDVTSWELVQAVVTEQGIVAPTEVERQARALPVHPALRECFINQGEAIVSIRPMLAI